MSASSFPASPPRTLAEAALEALATADPVAKCQRTFALSAAWRAGTLAADSAPVPMPRRPARPACPELRQPRDMPKRRRAGSPANRAALLHALAHIELNAIDLAWDIVARFGHLFPAAFCDDWVQVADDEARHFLALGERLAFYDAAYGDLPAHDGLWQAAEASSHDPAIRLAIVPMVLEARGLDVTPAMWESLEKVGDATSADAIRVIHAEEITHVGAGQRWFAYLCRQRNLPPVPTWQTLVQTHFKGKLKRPFNTRSRAQAGLTPDYYEPLATD